MSVDFATCHYCKFKNQIYAEAEIQADTWELRVECLSCGYEIDWQIPINEGLKAQMFADKWNEQMKKLGGNEK